MHSPRIYSWFHENGFFRVHNFSNHYLSILLKAGSWGNRFHETPCIYRPKITWPVYNKKKGSELWKQSFFFWLHPIMIKYCFLNKRAGAWTCLISLFALSGEYNHLFRRINFSIQGHGIQIQTKSRHIICWKIFITA